MTLLEINSAFARRAREKRLARDKYEGILRRFISDCRESYVIEALSGIIVQRASALVHAHPLRSGDALQLATALVLKLKAQDIVLVSSDRKLLRAAKAEGLKIFDPEA